MKIDAKLIGPMTLQLRRPLTSPVDEAEFYVIGQKTYRKERIKTFQLGIITGLFMCAAIFTILEKLVGK